MPNKFGMKNEYDPITEIDGVAIKELISKIRKPFVCDFRKYYP